METRGFYTIFPAHPSSETPMTTTLSLSACFVSTVAAASAAVRTFVGKEPDAGHSAVDRVRFSA